MMNKSHFKQEHSLEKRLAESKKIRAKYPQRIPVVCEKAENSNLPPIDKNKFLVPNDLTIGQFIYVIRKRMKLKPETAIYIYIDNKLPSTSALMSQVYKDHKDEDGFLYVSYAGISYFGSF